MCYSAEDFIEIVRKEIPKVKVATLKPSETYQF